MVNVLKKHMEQIQVLEFDHMMMAVLEFVENIVVDHDGDDVDLEQEIDDGVSLALEIDDYRDLEWEIDDCRNLELVIDDCMDLEMMVADYANLEKMDNDRLEIVLRLLFCKYLNIKTYIYQIKSDFVKFLVDIKSVDCLVLFQNSTLSNW